MSEFQISDTIGAAPWVATLGASVRTPTFTPWNATPLGGPSDHAAEEEVVEPEPEIDPEAIRADAFAQGFEQGRRTVELEVAAERDAIARLAESLESLRPEPPQALAVLLAETVETLVRQIVGEVEIDPRVLASRAEQAAALVSDEIEPSRLIVHPDDMEALESARIPLQIAADPTLARGTVLLECATGWIEDGPAVRLDRLRAALDRLGAPE